MGTLSGFFGYILNFIYNLVSNYGVAIIIFSIVLKVLLLPLSIKQQKTLIKTNKIQDKIKNIQNKYSKKDGEKTTPEEQAKMNQELMALYKKEGISPFSGCLPTIIQLILLIAIFSVVRNPLTHMLKVDSQTVDKISNYITTENEGYKINKTYPQVSILKYISENKEKVIYVGNDENKEKTEEAAETAENKEENTVENTEQNEEQKTDEQVNNNDENEKKEEIKLNDLYINMNFLGIDLNKIPQENFGDFTVYIIPVLYVLTSVLSMKLTTMKTKKKNDEEEIIEVQKVVEPGEEEISTEESEDKKGKKEEEFNMSDQMNKNMSWFMPIMAVTIAIVAPLGLALYWLMNNVLMILERIIIGKILDSKKEA